MVYGGLFEINEDNLAALDCYEGYHKRIYDKKEVEVYDSDEKNIEQLHISEPEKQKVNRAKNTDRLSFKVQKIAGYQKIILEKIYNIKYK